MDRGCHYASGDYQRALAANRMPCSMSRKADCWDNAVAESFWGTIKAELLDDMELPSRAEAHRVVFEYIEAFYNRRRRHSSIAYGGVLHQQRHDQQQRRDRCRRPRR
jgi:putative transposase